MDLKEMKSRFKNIEFDSIFDKKIAGIEINDEYIKAIECEDKEGKIKISNFGLIEIDTSIVEGKIKNYQKVRNLFEKLLEKNNLKAKKVKLSLSSELIYNKIIEIPKEVQQLEESISWKIEEEFAVDIENVFYDYKKIGESDTGNFKYNVILLDKIEGEKYLKLLKSFDLKIISLEVNNISFNRLVKEYENNHNIRAIINVEEYNTNLAIFENQHLLYNKNIKIAGREINEDIKKVYGNKISDVKEYKQKNDILTDDLIVEKKISDLFYKINHYLNHFYSTNDKKVEVLYITGNGLGNINYFETLSQSLEYPVKAFDFDKVISENEINSIYTFEKFSKAISANIDFNKQYNLLPKDKQRINLLKYIPQIDLSFNFKKTIKVLIFLAIISIIPSGNSYINSQINKQQNLIRHAEDKLFKLSEQTGELDDLKNEYENIQREIKNNQEFVGSQKEWDGILKEIEDILPQGSWLNTFRVYNQDNFNLEGYVFKREILDEIKEKLSDSEFFKEVDIKSTTRDTIRRRNREYGVEVERNIYEFELEGEIRKHL